MTYDDLFRPASGSGGSGGSDALGKRSPRLYMTHESSAPSVVAFRSTSGRPALTVSSVKQTNSNLAHTAPNLHVNAKGTHMKFKHQANLSLQEVKVSQGVPSVPRLLMLLGDSEG